MKGCESVDVCQFLRVVSYMRPLNTSLVTQLAKRFDISPEGLTLLIQIANEGAKPMYN